VYEPDPRGLLTAREAVCEYYAARGDCVSPGSVILTTSTSEAYSYVFRLLCNSGDEVLVPQPSYPLFDFLAELHDVRLVRYPLLYDHGWMIDFHALWEALTERTRGIIVVHPNNPTGNFCKSQEMEQLNEICAARGIALIADEVFLDYSLGETAPQSFVSNADALTFTMSGISKICGLPQMKAAWLVASGPDELRCEAQSRLEVIADTYLSMNAPVQYALPALLLQRHVFQTQVQERIRANLAELDRQLTRLSADPAARPSEGRQQSPGERGSCTRLHLEGGWYAVLALPATRSGDELAMQILAEQGVYIHPGHFYDFPGPRYAVASLITPSYGFCCGLRKLVDTAALPI
jgi:alanine-synthesizing transaminase